MQLHTNNTKALCHLHISTGEEKDEDMEEELSKNEVILAATAMAQFSQNTLGSFTA